MVAAWMLMAVAAQVVPTDVGGAAQNAFQQSGRLYAALFYGVILLLLLAFGSYALLRMSRRYAERLRRKHAEPTPVPDVWKMHEMPETADGGKLDEEPDRES